MDHNGPVFLLILRLIAFDFVSSLMLSELVGNTIYDPDVHYRHLLFVIACRGRLTDSLEPTKMGENGFILQLK